MTDTSRPVSPYMAARYTDTDEYLTFVRRVLHGMAARVGSADVEALRSMVEIRTEFDHCIEQAVAGLRHDDDLPASWTEIGRALGTTRQAAQHRYGHVGGIRHQGGQPGGWR